MLKSFLEVLTATKIYESCYIWILCSKNLLHSFNIKITYIYYYLINNIKHKLLCETMAELNYNKIPLFIIAHKSYKNTSSMS